jgi:hypothetical protein
MFLPDEPLSFLKLYENVLCFTFSLRGCGNLRLQHAPRVQRSFVKTMA